MSGSQPRHLVADVLDKQVVDRNERHAGRVDGIVLTLRDNRPPRVSAIEISPITLLARINGAVARWYTRIDREFGANRGKPVRVPWIRLTHHPKHLRLDVDVEHTPLNAVERRLRSAIVERIPGAGS